MPTTLATIRASVRADLHDTDSNNYRWSDASLDRAIARAVRRFSYAWPQLIVHSIGQAQAEQTEFDILTGHSTMAPLMNVLRVEAPAYASPPAFVRFDFRPPKTLTVYPASPLVEGDYITIHFEGYHVVDTNGCTIPDYLLEIVENGAAGFASLEWANFAINRVNVDDDATRQYKAWAADRLTLFFRDLKDLARRRVQNQGGIATPATVAITGYDL